MPRRARVAMLLENNPYPKDVRVRAEATSLVRAGHSVTVIAPRGPGEPRREMIDGVDVRRFRAVDGHSHGPLGFALEYVVAGLALHGAALRQLLTGATVLHIHNPPDILFPAGMLFRLAGRQVIFDHHDLFPETIEVKFGSRLATRLGALFQRLTYGVADHVLATNASYADLAMRRGGKAPTEVTIVRNAPPEDWLALPPHEREGTLEDVRLAYVGVIASQDGVEGLAPVLARLRTVHALDARLTVIGDGDGRGAVEAELTRHGVASAATFTGFVPRERVPELMLEADICVDPSPATLVNELSTMMKVAEYLAVGKPVVAYDLLETRRTAGDAAVLVPHGDVAAFADAIAELARDPSLRRRLAREARARAAGLTWEHSERALLAAYDTLASGGSAPSRRWRWRARRAGSRAPGRASDG